MLHRQSGLVGQGLAYHGIYGWGLPDTGKTRAYGTSGHKII